jgi:hypothetical protein
MQVSHLACHPSSNPGKLLILTHRTEPQALHSASVVQTAGHSLASTAEVDSAKAAMTTRTKRIVYDLCDMGSGNSERNSKKTDSFYVLNVVLMYMVVLSYLQYQQILPAEVWY